jgi:hypothetical protein
MQRVIFAAICVLLAAGCAAHSVGGLAEILVVDRDSGAALPMHLYRGEYWIAGQPGAHYAIEIRNRIGERVLAVTSIDGVNVLSGATAAWDQAGYVFDPGERYQITGWRKSDTSVAAFTFTASPNSYAERTGRPANVGVIGVAIFRERQPQSTYLSSINGQSPADSIAMAQSSRASAAPKLGTGHGEREDSYVNYTEFSRLQSQPNEIIRIHYDSLDNLFAMGIVRRPIPTGPNPFPGSALPQYVPDPPG